MFARVSLILTTEHRRLSTRSASSKLLLSLPLSLSLSLSQRNNFTKLRKLCFPSDRQKRTRRQRPRSSSPTRKQLCPRKRLRRWPRNPASNPPRAIRRLPESRRSWRRWRNWTRSTVRGRRMGGARRSNKRNGRTIRWRLTGQAGITRISNSKIRDSTSVPSCWRRSHRPPRPPTRPRPAARSRR